MKRALAASAVAFAAGWLSACEARRRRDRHARATSRVRRDAMRQQGPPWAWNALRQCLAAAEPGETAASITVAFTGPGGAQTAAGMDRDDTEPDRFALEPVTGEDGTEVGARFHPLGVPDDASGLESER